MALRASSKVGPPLLVAMCAGDHACPAVDIDDVLGEKVADMLVPRLVSGLSNNPPEGHFDVGCAINGSQLCSDSRRTLQMRHHGFLELGKRLGNDAAESLQQGRQRQAGVSQCEAGK